MARIDNPSGYSKEKVKYRLVKHYNRDEILVMHFTGMGTDVTTNKIRHMIFPDNINICNSSGAEYLADKDYWNLVDCIRQLKTEIKEGKYMHNYDMGKTYVVTGPSESKGFNKLQDAVDYASRRVGKNIDEVVYIYEAIKEIKSETPPVVITDLSKALPAK